MPPLFIYLLVINSISFLANGVDKWLAINQKWRISEKLLLGFTLIGGTIGAIIGMVIFRHKLSKSSYLWKFFGIVIFQIVAVYLYLKN